MLPDNEQLIAHLQATGVLVTRTIIDAFRTVDRGLFVPDRHKHEAYGDYPLPIGYDQTISQPTTVAFMLEQLQPQRGQRVLDLGSGSGWTTALLAEIVGMQGRVIGMERIPELVTMGKENISRFGYRHATIIQATSGVPGVPDRLPFHRILVSAAATDLPHELVGQLAAPGAMVIPIQGAIWKVGKTHDGTTNVRRFPGFVFVPFKI